MTLIIKQVFAFIILGSMQVPAFPQERKSAVSFYNSAVSLKKKDPSKSFQLLERAMKLSQERKEWNIYFQSINELARLSSDLSEEKQTAAFNWIKAALKNPEAS